MNKTIPVIVVFLIGAAVTPLTIGQFNINTPLTNETVTQNENLTAIFNGPYQGYINTPITFNATATGGEKPYSFEWDFGDGSEISFLQQPTHIYKNAGTYTITVNVTDSQLYQQNQDIVTAEITIEDENINPTLTIEKPSQGLYINDNMIISLQSTIILGDLTIKASATDDESGLRNVTFAVNGDMKEEVIIPPYTWLWDIGTFGKNVISVTANDYTGNSETREITVFKLL